MQKILEEGQTDAEIKDLVKDELSDAVQRVDAAYAYAVAAWGEKDKRTEKINALWAECERLSNEFK